MACACLDTSGVFAHQTSTAFCGYCGSNMVGVSGTGKLGKKHSYYACSKRLKEHKCNKNNEKKDYIEKYVVERNFKI
ncbi:MAG: zinc ribbon domain-containing protein [Clostridia bacterium]|nr:zinc ribbon domain-containing protein [Clostridia bacterium]